MDHATCTCAPREGAGDPLLEVCFLLLDHSRSMTTETYSPSLIWISLSLHLRVDLQFWFCLEHFLFIFTCCLLII